MRTIFYREAFLAQWANLWLIISVRLLSTS